MKRLDTTSFELTNQNSVKVPKVFLSQRIQKRVYKTLDTTVITSPLSPPSPRYITP